MLFIDIRLFCLTVIVKLEYYRQVINVRIFVSFVDLMKNFRILGR